MEIKVWVEGVVRVVCGISQTTSCQDVVISLAQAIGQTGRYVLVLQFRGTERQLGADECPLQHLNKLGQFAGEVQFILRWTGPSLSAGQDKTSRVIHPALLKPPKPESVKHRKPKKALTFSLGPSTDPRRTQSNQAWSPSPRTSPEPKASPVNWQNMIQWDGTSKEEVFRQILQQQMMLEDLEHHLQALEDDTEWQEQVMANAAIPGWNLVATDELNRLEHRFRHNEAELMMSQLWGESLQEEIDREQDLQSRLNHVQSSVEDQTSQIEELLDLFAHLQSDISTSQVDTQHPLEILRPLKQELKQRAQQGEELKDTLSKTSRDIQAAEERLRGRWETVEELNKELRQCNLQHFIQQTSTAPLVDQTSYLPVTDAYLNNAAFME
ncbi:ras association domain-containing protein 7-like isoform X2 [Dunckerocampus dactyliophorus]|nr:ras association domain-containing protein 7-like isoform X2 [Dunckerocampus dactyliophorus]XP_054627365.1 ras association domain-containing protein 7-like isoform X2 [Dunckerocampus dactyliophorus]